MKLLREQALAFDRVLDVLGDSLGLMQKEIADKIKGSQGIELAASELSKVKNGYPIGDRKYASILDGLEHLAELEGKALSPSQLAELREQIRFLRQSPSELLGVSRVDLGRDEELIRASEALAAIHKVSPDLIHLQPLKHLYLLEDEYSHINHGLQTVKVRLRAAINELNLRRDKQQDWTINRSGAHRKYGRVRWANAQTMPAICLFPFFLTARRRFSWGVIRYGVQRAIGLVVPPFALPGYSSKTGEYPTWSANDCRAFFVERAPEIRLYSVSGYAAEDILCQMALRWGDVHSLRVFNTALSNPNDTYEDAFHELVQDPSGILAFDLADVQTVSDFLTAHLADMRIVRLNHGVEVPVGIGFSLPAFPWVVHNQRHKQLRTVATHALNEYRDELSEIGIDLD